MLDAGYRLPTDPLMSKKRRDQLTARLGETLTGGGRCREAQATSSPPTGVGAAELTPRGRSQQRFGITRRLESSRHTFQISLKPMKTPELPIRKS